jgi:leader peptidase (prepilin peptidase) / N-methyltransferase
VRAPDPLILGFATVFGAMLGSFLNVVIHRLPDGKSLAWPGSHCPKCGAAIRWYDNVPILSWLLLLGRCRSCRAGISPRYIVVEALTAALIAAVAVRTIVGREPRDFAAFGALTLFVAALVAASFIDLALQIIPDRITKPGMVAAPLLAALAPSISAADPARDALSGLPPAGAALITSLLGIAAGAGLIWLVGVLGKAAFRREAMGFGDVKFMGLIGGFVGPVGVVLAILVACLFGAAIGGLRFLVTRKKDIPFGPFLAMGALVVVFFRADVVRFLLVTWPSLLR